MKKFGEDKWIICPGCGRTIKVIQEGEDVNMPEVCPHCGNDVWYEEEKNDSATMEQMGIIPKG